MGDILTRVSYRQEIIKAMQMLAEDERVVCIGQNVIYSGAIDINKTVECFPDNRKIEVPIFENTHIGICTGLSLCGFIPLCIIPRMDFLIIAADQLVNHLDKIELISSGRFKPKVVIRTSIGAKYPLDAGPQHTQDHTEALKLLLTNIDMIKLEKVEDIVPAYQRALESERSTILIELGERMRE